MTRHLTVRRVALLALCVLAAGCAAEAPETSEPETVAEAVEPLKLYVLECGALTVGDVSMFNLSEEEAGTTDMFVPCYLIEHPQGRMLWDLGLPATVKTGEYEMEGGQLTLARTVSEQLAELDLTPADIDFLAMSHLHFDHCGQANEFSSSHHLIQRAEHEAAFADPPTVPFFQRDLYAGLESSETTVLDGDHDVFGDGRVVIKPAPGHTPGHQILFLDLEQTGPLVLSGDLYHFPANRELKRPPTFNFDADVTLASMESVEAFIAETGATLWIEHDAKLAATLEKSPSFYQ